mgnify:CR=1 FL=1
MLWGIFNIKYIRFLLVAAVATVGLTAVRLFPAAVSFGTQENHRDVYGYGLNPEFFLQTFISIRNILDHPAFAWWEYSNYISLFGFLAIFYFCFINYFIYNTNSSIESFGDKIINHNKLKSIKLLRINKLFITLFIISFCY